MKNEKVLKNGYLALSGRDDFIKKDLRIKNGKIVEIADKIDADDFQDLEGLHVFPGGIDPHVHFDDPGFTQREDFFHGTAAAASGGITTIIDMPCTSLPPVTNLKNLKNKLEIVSKKAVIDFAFYGGISSNCFEDYKQNIEKLANYVVGFKTYFISGMETFGALDLFSFEQVLKETKKYGIPVLLHAENESYIQKATSYYKEKEDSYNNYYNSRPEIAEKLAIIDAVEIAKKNDADLHIVHIGIGEAAQIIKKYDFITGETCPHYLEYNKHDLEKIGSPLKVAPCIKRNINKKLLWNALQKGEINYIASDHAPAPHSGKFSGSTWTDYSGIPGTGTLFPYILSEGFLKKKLTLSKTLEVISENAAKRWGLYDRKGSIAIGKDADLAIFDLKEDWLVEGEKFLSKGKITPFEKRRFKGKLIETWVRGELVFSEKNKITIPAGFGEHIKRD